MLWALHPWGYSEVNLTWPSATWGKFALDRTEIWSGHLQKPLPACYSLILCLVEVMCHLPGAERTLIGTRHEEGNKFWWDFEEVGMWRGYLFRGGALHQLSRTLVGHITQQPGMALWPSAQAKGSHPTWPSRQSCGHSSKSQGCSSGWGVLNHLPQPWLTPLTGGSCWRDRPQCRPQTAGSA